MNLSQRSINIVVSYQNQLYKYTLDPTQYSRFAVANEQITLPNHCYSTGFYERISDNNWSDLMNLPPHLFHILSISKPIG